MASQPYAALRPLSDAHLSWSGLAMRGAERELSDIGAAPSPERVAQVLERLADQLMPLVAGERADLRHLHALTLKANYQEVSAEVGGLTSVSGIREFAVLPNGEIVTSEVGGFLAVWRRELNGARWVRSGLFAADSGAPPIDTDGQGRILTSITEQEVGFLSRAPVLGWTYSRVAVVASPIRSVEALPDGSVVIVCVGEVSIVSRNEQGWSKRTCRFQSAPTAIDVTPSGWLVAGDKMKVIGLHRSWGPDSNRVLLLGEIGPYQVPEKIEHLRVLSDRSIAVGRLGGQLCVLEPLEAQDEKWRCHWLCASGESIVAMQATPSHGILVTRSDGTVSLWSREAASSPRDGFLHFSRPQREQRWSERVVISSDQVSASMGQQRYKVHDGRVLPHGSIVLAGECEGQGRVLIFDGEPEARSTDSRGAQGGDPL